MIDRLGIDWREEGNELKAYLKDGREAAWAPQPGSQQFFLECNVFEALLEGNRGGGKTDVLLMDFAQECGKGFGVDWRGILFRHTYKQLEDVVAKTKKWFPRIFPQATFNSAAMHWDWSTGERLYLSYLERESDYWNYHGHAYPWIGFEELTTWPTDGPYKVMMSCCRSTRTGVWQSEINENGLVVPKWLPMPRKYRATTNPYGCVPHGEVLTSTGWRDIRTIGAGDRVVSFDRHGISKLSIVERRTERDYDGEMIVRKGRGLNMEFTPNHRLPVLRGNSNELVAFDSTSGQVNLAGAVNRWIGTRLEKFDVPLTYHGRKRKLSQPLSLSGEDYATLMGWYLSEGSCSDRDKAVFISQSKPKTRRKLEEFLRRAGFSFGKTFNQVWISSHEWWSYLRQFGHAVDKFVPRSLLNAEESTLRAFLESVVDGDGSWREEGFSYASISKRLADDVAEVAIKLGYRVTMTSRDRKNEKYPTRKRCYEVLVSKNKPVQLMTGNHVYAVETKNLAVNVERVPFKGKVYCLVVPGDESFVIRQGKNVWLSGNSGHNWCKLRFGLPVSPGKMTTPIKDNRVAIHSDLEENKLLLRAEPDYLDKVTAAAMNSAQAKAWREGSWDIVAGGMIDDVWDPAIHVTPAMPFDLIPHTWRINRSYDHGQSKPFSVGWWAESSGEPVVVNGKNYGGVPGDLFRIAEWYGWNGEPNKGLRMSSGDIALGIVRREKDWGAVGRVRQGPADSSIFDDWEPGSSVAGEMRARGVLWQPANKGPGSRKQGWQAIRAMLESARKKPRENPGLFICENCQQFIRTVPVLPRSEKDMDDVDTEAEDHVGDEVRYRVREKIYAAKSRSF